MSLNYFKRFRMEIDLTGRDFSRFALPSGYRLVAWDPGLVDLHGEIKYLSFRGELDSNVFPCLGELTGCLRLMNEISQKPGFMPGATWLIAHVPAGQQQYDYCGTIQGVCDRTGMGAIQNLGVLLEHRCHGLGAILMQKALEGFQRAGIRQAFLEVTAQNEGAIRLYRRLGFRKARTVYKVVEVAYS